MNRDKVTETLKECGAVLIRQRKHEVWRLPNNRIFVKGVSPSDRRSPRNDLADLRKALNGGKENESNDKSRV